eukprot:NODE_5734_length_555_cov_16.986166_g4996_i0.p4 GENE.NODE_5734_length_555_cov_16.986166_g4996_i0~~NODE_5734_length_555_cov_16.986166_g4996_i0.p4  ORF type:complete len:112 (-),score=32.33 NODE_5734_length_555_cov_16.986166_g4996_i0:135-470(-)
MEPEPPPPIPNTSTASTGASMASALGRARPPYFAMLPCNTPPPLNSEPSKRAHGPDLARTTTRALPNVRNTSAMNSILDAVAKKTHLPLQQKRPNLRKKKVTDGTRRDSLL